METCCSVCAGCVGGCGVEDGNEVCRSITRLPGRESVDWMLIWTLLEQSPMPSVVMILASRMDFEMFNAVDLRVEEIWVLGSKFTFLEFT